MATFAECALWTSRNIRGLVAGNDVAMCNGYRSVQWSEWAGDLWADLILSEYAFDPENHRYDKWVVRVVATGEVVFGGEKGGEDGG